MFLNNFHNKAKFSIQSLDIWSAVWDSDWHLIDVNNQKMIFMLILRGQEAKLIKVPFFEVTLTAYTKVRFVIRSMGSHTICKDTDLCLYLVLIFRFRL